MDPLRSVSKQFVHGFTYNGHPACVAAGRAVLNVINSKSLFGRTQSLEKVMREQLSSLLKLDAVGDVRGLGLLWGIEFVADKKTKATFPADFNFAGKIGAECSARGVMVYPMQGTVDGYAGDHLLIAPPAVITEDQIAESARVIGEAATAVSSSIKTK
jgi:adenosylmethionine-8-amino-7-oxononanoate aminotransferase